MLVGGLVPSGAGAQSSADAPVFAVALGSSLADVGAATLLVAAGEADAVLLVDAPEVAGAAAVGLVRSHGASGFVLVGGPAAISAAVEAELKGLAPRAAVSRVWGADREATAAAVARQVLRGFSDPRGAVVALANGWSPADAAAASAAVAAGGVDAVLWTAGDSLSAHAAAVLREFKVRRVLVIGGPAALSEPVATAAGTAAGATVRRVGGATRTGTAVMAAQVATAGRISAAVVADGWDLQAVSQAAGLAAAVPDAVVLFAEPGGTLGDTAAQFLADSRPARVWVLSSDPEVRDELARSAREALPSTMLTRIDSAAAATATAIEASHRPDPRTGSSSGSGGGGGSGSGSGGGGPQVTTPPAAPARPTGVTARLTGSGSITVSWDAHPQASSLTAIRVSWGATGPDAGHDLGGQADLRPTLTSETFTGLNGGVAYRFEVIARGPGGDTSAAPVQLTACVTPGAPANPAATADGSTVTLSWDAPAGRNCAVTRYEIERSNSGTIVSHNVDGNADPLQLVIENLADDDYNFGIRTVNALGRSTQRAFAAATVSTALDAPPSPSGVTAARDGERAVTVGWTAATGTAAAPVHGYTVKWQESDGANPLTHRVESGAISFKVPNLTPGQAYSFTVASYNAHPQSGTVKESANANTAAATPCGAPRPSDITVTETPGTGMGVTDGTLDISWTLPTVPSGCSITGIELQHAAFAIPDGEDEVKTNPGAMTVWTAETVSGSTATSASVTVSNADLTANDYTARVRVTNSAGLVSQWNLPGHRGSPLGNELVFVDGTPVYNHQLGRLWMMVGGYDDTDGSEVSGGNWSAVCRRHGDPINCPPLTLVSLDIFDALGSDISVSFEVSHVQLTGFRGEPSTAEVGGPAGPEHVLVSGGDASLAIAWSSVSTPGGRSNSQTGGLQGRVPPRRRVRLHRGHPRGRRCAPAHHHRAAQRRHLPRACQRVQQRRQRGDGHGGGLRPRRERRVARRQLPRRVQLHPPHRAARRHTERHPISARQPHGDRGRRQAHRRLGPARQHRRRQGARVPGPPQAQHRRRQRLRDPHPTVAAIQPRHRRARQSGFRIQCACLCRTDPGPQRQRRQRLDHHRHHPHPHQLGAPPVHRPTPLPAQGSEVGHWPSH